MTELSITAL